MADELRKTLDAWARAVVERDRAAAEELLAESFVLTSAGGVAARMERADWLASLPSIESESLEVLDTRSGRSVTWGHEHAPALERPEGGRDLSGDYAIVDVFERSGGSWRAAWRISRKVA